MENIALIESFSEFKDEKSIDRVTLMAILEEVFRSALKRKYGSDENFDIIINPDKGDLEIWRNRIVVDDGEIEDEWRPRAGWARAPRRRGADTRPGGSPSPEGCPCSCRAAGGARTPWFARRRSGPS